MAKSGSIEIIGTIDVTSIKHGLKEMKNGLDDAKTAARSSFGDLKRMGGALSGIAGPLAAIGTSLGGLMFGIAAMSPAIAPVLARMQVDFLRLSRILGEHLKPVFEAVAAGFTKFVNFVEENQEVLSALGGVLAEIVTTVGGFVWDAVEEFVNFLKANKEELKAIAGYISLILKSPEEVRGEKERQKAIQEPLIEYARENAGIVGDLFMRTATGFWQDAVSRVKFPGQKVSPFEIPLIIGSMWAKKQLGIEDWGDVIPFLPKSAVDVNGNLGASAPDMNAFREDQMIEAYEYMRSFARTDENFYKLMRYSNTGRP